MTESVINEQLQAFESKHENNWQHLIFNLRKHMDSWNGQHVKSNSVPLKHSYLPVLFNIPVAGSTATQIGRRSKLIKQNMSRTIKELQHIGMITARVNKRDKRSERLDLTIAAKEIVLDGHISLANLQQDYKNLVGERDFEIATNVLLKIIAYHEDLERQNSNIDTDHD